MLDVLGRRRRFTSTTARLDEHRARGAVLVLSGLLSTSCGSSNSKVAFELLSSPENAAKVLVEEESEIADVCASFEPSTEAKSTKVTDLLARERRENLGALLAALDPDAARGNSCFADNLGQCVGDLKAAYAKARELEGNAERVAQSIGSAFGELGDISELDDRRVQLLAQKLRFSVFAVDGYIRIANGLEREVDQFIDALEIPIPLASSIARGLAREATAEIIASGTDDVVHMLEQHSLVHRPAMIRQACERYFRSTNHGSIASHGLRRIILSAATEPTKFAVQRCERLELVAKEKDGGQTVYKACGVISQAALDGRVSAERVVVSDDKSLRSPEYLSKGFVPPALRDSNPQHDLAQAARTLQAAALACTSDEKTTCTLDLFNTLGSAASMDPPAAGRGEGNVPNLSEVNKLLSLVHEFARMHGETKGKIARLEISIEALQGMTSARLNQLDRSLVDVSRAQREVAAATRHCAQQRKKVRAARQAMFEKLGTGATFEEVCSESYGRRFTHRNLPLPAADASEATAVLDFYVSDLCNEQRHIQVAVRFADGMFGLGKSELTKSRSQQLTQAWTAMTTAAERVITGPVHVVGLVDPTGFRRGVYAESQEKLMLDRAQAVVAVLEQNSGAQFHARAGDIPPLGACTHTDACAEWRTVSLETQALFPVLEVATCGM